MPPLPGPRVVLCCTRYPVKTCTTPSAIRTGKCTVSSRWVVLRIRRMFGSRWSLSAAMLNCSSATSQGSRWVWSITAADVFTKPSVPSWGRPQLLDHEPIVVRLAGSVRAVPVLDHDALEALREKCVAPGAQTSCDKGREPDVLARREDTLEVTAPLEQRDGQQGLAIDLEQVEGGEDLPRAILAGIGVALVINFEVALVAPIVDQDTIDDRGIATGIRDDRVVELARAGRRAAVADETWVAMADPHQDACAGPLRLEDVVLRLRALADEAGALRRQVDAEDRAQIFEYPALDIVNICSIMRTPVRNSFFRGAPWPPHPRFS